MTYTPYTDFAPRETGWVEVAKPCDHNNPGNFAASEWHYLPSGGRERHIWCRGCGEEQGMETEGGLHADPRG